MSPATMTTRDAVAVMARAPVPGQVKRRLAATLGDSIAALLYRAMLRDCLALAAAAVSSTQAVLCYTPTDAFAPDNTYSLAPLWSGNRLQQCEGDIGRRMSHVFETLRTHGASRIIIIGSDAPDIPHEYLGHALKLLHQADLVLGPAKDGGFYLVGASVPLDEKLFDNVRWSIQSTLADVFDNAAQLQLQIELIPDWSDVDEIADLRSLATRLQNGISCAPFTQEALASHDLLEH